MQIFQQIEVGNGKNKRFFISLFLVLFPLLNLFTQPPSWTKVNTSYHDTCHFEEQKKRAFVLGYNYLSEKYNVKVFSRIFDDGYIKKYVFNDDNKLILLKITNEGDTNYLNEEKYFYSKNGQLDSINSFVRFVDGSESTKFKKYIYEQNGNLKKVKENEKIIVYKYDSLNRLKKRVLYNNKDTTTWIISYFDKPSNNMIFKKKDSSYFEKPGESMTLIKKDSTDYYQYIYNNKNKLITKLDDDNVRYYYYWEGKVIKEINYKYMILYRYKNNEVKYFSENLGGDFSHTFVEFNSHDFPAKDITYKRCDQYAPENCKVKQESTYEYEFFDE